MSSEGPDAPPPPTPRDQVLRAVRRAAIAVGGYLVAAFGMGMAALGGCCDGPRGDVMLVVLWVGTAFAISLWAITVVLHRRWFPLFLPLGWLLAYLEVT
ncbi:hypothetical protein FTX61_05560 [Nitriliruptoraceae bacterium ZYF776]|nr:hypothetical protein [Profundirhabdus halotolerans]